ncbi:hypothetical protein BC833DRAFT_623442 [Globomyces pollinis-pini]|nr:hypothetical protein BC833DRAFT_623442 [Globomyces pollinis-pini]
MLPGHVEFNPIHTSQSLFVVSSDGSKIISCGGNKLVSNALPSIASGHVDSESGTIVSCGNSNTTITCLAIYENWLVVGSDDNECRLFRLRPLKFHHTLTRRSGAIRSVTFGNDGLVAIGSDEPTITLVNIYSHDFSEVLEGHTNAIKSLSMNKSSTTLVSTSSDGLIKIWFKKFTWQCLHTFDSIIKTSLPESIEHYRTVWHPTGDYFAVCGLGGDVLGIKNNTWDVIFTLNHTEDIMDLKFSTNGLYLMCIGNKKLLSVWKPDEKTTLPMFSTSHEYRIMSCEWHPIENDIVLSDQKGNVMYWKSFIVNSQPHPAKALEATKKASQSVDDELFGDEDMNDLSAFDTEAVEEVGEEDQDFVVDDDGGGYIEALDTDVGYQRYEDRNRRNLLQKMDREQLLFGEKRPAQAVTVYQPQEGQAAFQPGSCAPKGNRHYLLFNLIGTVCSIESGIQHTVDIQFNDTSQRPFHFTDHNKYTLACLGQTGAVFASEGTATLPSSVLYRPYSNWASKNDWTIQLPDGEKVEALAITSRCIAVATDRQYIRFLTTSGVQTNIRSITGPIVSMCGNDNLLLVVYHDGGVFQKHQNLGYILIDVLLNKTLVNAKLPISPYSTLTWLGFSDIGIPLTYDSAGILRGLFVHSDNSWTPIFDSKLVEGVSGTNLSYWPVGVTETNFLCVICRGEQTPVFPKPVINDFPLTIPFAQFDSERVKMEERIAKGRLILEQHRNLDEQVESNMGLIRQEAQLDRLSIQLIASACKAEQSQRVIDLVTCCYNLKTFDAAIKLASYNHLPALAERLSAMKEAKYKQLEAINSMNEEESMGHYHYQRSAIQSIEPPISNLVRPTKPELPNYKSIVPETQPTQVAVQKKTNRVETIQELDDFDDNPTRTNAHQAQPAVDMNDDADFEDLPLKETIIADTIPTHTTNRTETKKIKKNNPFATKKTTTDKLKSTGATIFSELSTIAKQSDTTVADLHPIEKKRKQTTLSTLFSKSTTNPNSEHMEKKSKLIEDKQMDSTVDDKQVDEPVSTKTVEQKKQTVVELKAGSSKVVTNSILSHFSFKENPTPLKESSRENGVEMQVDANMDPNDKSHQELAKMFDTDGDREDTEKENQVGDGVPDYGAPHKGKAPADPSTSLRHVS